MSERDPRLSLQTLQVLAALIEIAPRELPGVDIAQRAKLSSGTLYPILRRLEDARWLDSRWEDLDPREAGRPRRRFYTVTQLGAEKAVAALSALAPSVGALRPIFGGGR